ncbi:ASCH domain-containing protein [Maricaulis sp. CAU 1757]
MTPDQRAFWQQFQAATGSTAEPFEIGGFGDDPAMNDELLALVLAGRKRATCALARHYRGDGLRLVEPGDVSLILDGRGAPACVVRTTSVEVRPVRTADAAFAWDEGEGDGSLDYWMREHLAYWQREAARDGFAFSEDMDGVFERFELAWHPGM